MIQLPDGIGPSSGFNAPHWREAHGSTVSPTEKRGEHPIMAIDDLLNAIDELEADMASDLAEPEEDAIAAMVDAALSRGPHDDYSIDYLRTPEGHPQECEVCGGRWHGLPQGDCPGSFDDTADQPDDSYTVEFVIEVDADMARTVRDAAQLAYDVFKTGWITCTVIDPDGRGHEVELTND